MQGRVSCGFGCNPNGCVGNSTPVVVAAVPPVAAVVILDQAAPAGRDVSAIVPAERRQVLLRSPLCCRRCDL